jgi:hypothetical protein
MGSEEGHSRSAVLELVYRACRVHWLDSSFHRFSKSLRLFFCSFAARSVQRALQHSADSCVFFVEAVENSMQCLASLTGTYDLRKCDLFEWGFGRLDVLRVLTRLSTKTEWGLRRIGPLSNSLPFQSGGSEAKILK